MSSCWVFWYFFFTTCSSLARSLTANFTTGVKIHIWTFPHGKRMMQSSSALHSHYEINTMPNSWPLEPRHCEALNRTLSDRSGHWTNRYRETGKVTERHISGRPLGSVLPNWMMNAIQFLAYLRKEWGTQVSHQTIQNRLQLRGLRKRQPGRLPDSTVWNTLSSFMGAFTLDKGPVGLSVVLLINFNPH